MTLPSLPEEDKHASVNLSVVRISQGRKACTLYIHALYIALSAASIKRLEVTGVRESTSTRAVVISRRLNGWLQSSFVVGVDRRTAGCGGLLGHIHNRGVKSASVPDEKANQTLPRFLFGPSGTVSSTQIQ